MTVPAWFVAVTATVFCPGVVQVRESASCRAPVRVVGALPVTCQVYRRGSVAVGGSTVAVKGWASPMLA